MTAMTQPAVVWRATKFGAELQCGPLQGFVSCDEIGFRFVVRSWKGTASKGPRVLASRRLENSTEDHFQVQDAYIRGNDFVQSFRPTAPHSITSQAYWRALHAERFNAVR